MHLRTHATIWRSVLALLCVCASALPAWSPPAAAQAAALVIAPAALDLTLPLGETTTRTITLRNSGTTPLALRLFEANATVPAATQRARPQSVQAALPTQATRIDQHLLAAYTAAPSTPRDFLVYLRTQADLSAAYRISDWAARGRYVYQALSAHAAVEQRGLTEQLAARGLAYRSLWAVNALLVRGTLADARALAARAEVALIRDNYIQAAPQAPARSAPGTCSPDAPDNPICWNIRTIGADRVWRDFGVNGRGVVVANLDTGVDNTHPALAAAYRGYNGSAPPDHDYNWYDPQGQFADPTDENGHGTHTMGTMVGVGTTAAQPGVGAAPGAAWIAAQGCEASFCSDADLISGAQWLLAPTRRDGSAPRPDLRPMIVNNSWASDAGDGWYAPYTAAWRAAGMFPVFAAGNADGEHPQVCGSAASPGDYADVVAAGALRRDGTLASFSLLGPTRDGRLKPDFVAPGVDIYSTAPLALGGYQSLSGTSMAAPLIAGAVALLWSANPALLGDYDATYALLRDTAVPIPDARCGTAPDGANNLYGHGLIDIYAAVARAKVDLPWLAIASDEITLAPNDDQDVTVRFDTGRLPGPGVYQAKIAVYGDPAASPLSVPVTLRVSAAAAQTTVTGRVVSAETGAPLAAVVAVSRDSARGFELATTADGRFQLTLPDTVAYTLTVQARSYLSSHTRFTVAPGLDLQVALGSDQARLATPTEPLTVSVDFATTATRSIPIKNTGTRPLYYQLSVPQDSFIVARSDEAAGPAYHWIDLPADAKLLKSGQDVLQEHISLGITFPFYTYVLTDAVVTSNGMLTFDRPFSYHGPTTNCMPDEWINFYMIAPLRLGLDSTKGGRVRYGTVSDQFVVSYEQVPLRDGDPNATYTFQVVLLADGRIQFQYQQLAALPSRASVGVQRSPFDILQIGCGPTTPIHDGLLIELRPQPSSQLWLATNVVSGTLQPGERTDIPIRVGWLRPGTHAPYYQGHVRFSSNDALHRDIAVPVQLYPRRALYEQWLLFVTHE